MHKVYNDSHAAQSIKLDSFDILQQIIEHERNELKQKKNHVNISKYHIGGTEWPRCETKLEVFHIRFWKEVFLVIAIKLKSNYVDEGTLGKNIVMTESLIN